MIEHLSADRFHEHAKKALDDTTLRGALDRATTLFGDRRSKALSEVSDWEEMREQGRQIKAEVLADLDRYLEEFVAHAEAVGVVVHWARDGKEACEIVSKIARDRVAHTIVKSKSMTTEEIGLNHALEDRGLVPIETDLGEWIIQLAGETPSHIIVPAIHKTRGQIADLFRAELGTERTEDPEELTKIARRILRRSFADADIGISGVNFAIAETGSFLVLENEGNARMTTSLPRLHLAVMGIEKVIPRIADLEVFLRLLPRSGTGQHLTSYQTLFTGPRRGPEDEGPEELHVLILDNGRSGMLHEEVERAALACIRCGACLNACPVYRQVGGHAYGSVYPGPIGAVITPQLAGIEKAAQLPFASTLCSACRDVCPVKIDIPRLLLHLRAKVVKERATRIDPRLPVAGRMGERLAFRAWAWAMCSPWRYRQLARCMRALVPLANSRGWIGRLARALSRPLVAWTSSRELPMPAPRSFRATWASELSHSTTSEDRT